MTTPTLHLGLSKPTTSDNFVTADIAAVYDEIDAAPGITICTSGTRPGAWGSDQEGLCIIEKDTGLVWRWNGSAFVRQGPSGWLGGNRRTADFTLVDGSFGVVVQQTTINVPAGDRRVKITLAWNKVDLTTSGGTGEWALFRGATQLVAFDIDPHGGSYSYTHVPGTGIYTFAAKAKGVGTAGFVRADATHPCSIDIEEI